MVYQMQNVVSNTQLYTGIQQQQSSIYQQKMFNKAPQIYLLEHHFQQRRHENMTLKNFKESQKCPCSYVQQLQSFLSMLYFMQPYIRNIPHHTTPLRELLKKNQAICLVLGRATAQYAQDCPIFFIQLNHVHK